MSKTVELFQAFAWTCDDCGRDNFTRGITLAPASIDLDQVEAHDEETAEAIREWIASGNSGDFVQAPGRVRCEHCGAEFEAIAL